MDCILNVSRLNKGMFNGNKVENDDTQGYQISKQSSDIDFFESLQALLL